MVDASTPKTVLSSSEVAFPRGGATALTPLEVKEISNEVTKDVLFEAANSSKRSSSSKSDQVSKKPKKSKKKVVVEKVKEDESVQIENFNYKNLIPGTMILGQVIEIGNTDISIAIGDNLVGYVPITLISEEITNMIEKYQEDEDDDESEIEDENEDVIKTATLKSKELPNLDKLFSIGQWLKATIVENSNPKKKRIQLSIEPEIVNKSLEKEDLIISNLLQCSVKSIEDHGIILNTGLKEFTGFISNKELKNANKDPQNIQIGSVLLTSIVSAPSKRTITLRPIESSSYSKKSTISSIVSVDSIQPGILIDALISDITKNGLIIKAFGLVDATINLAHLREFELSKLKHKYTIGNNIKARVIGVLLKSGTKKLILSTLPNIIGLSTENHKLDALEAFPIGHVLDEVEVTGSDPNYIFVKTGSSILGQIHNSNVDPSKQIDIEYNIGSKHKARVIGYNQIDGTLMLTLKPDIVNSKYMSAHDIPAGTFIPGVEIVKVLPDAGGIQVKFLNSFEGFVPSTQMSDIKLVYPERKFKAGSKVKARVLTNQGRTTILTLKKSLVNIEDEDVLSSFEDAKIGLKTPATIEKFVHNGAIVSFFGNLRGYLPKNEISETFVNQASEHLKLNQTVNVKILDVRKDEKRLIVTLRQSSELTNTQKSAINELIPGKSIVTAVINEKTKDSVIFEVEESNLRGVIYNGHLSDGNYEQNRSRAKKLPIGEKIEVLVLEKDLKARTIIASAKPSLIEASKRDAVPAYFKDITIDNKLLHGYIKSVTNMGLFVSFGGKLTGLVLAKYATDNENDDLSKKFYKYQSVACRVIRIDEDNKRFLLSMKESTNESALDNESVVNPVDKTKRSIGEYVPGVITKAEIRSVKGTQLNVQLADNLQGRVDIIQCFNNWDEIKDKSQPLSQFHKGDILTVKVIGFHDAKNHRFLAITHRKSNKNFILELSILKKEVESPNKPYEAPALSNFEKGTEVVTFVNNVAKGYVWTSVTPTLHGRISFMDLSNDVSIFEDIDHRLPIGSAIKATVKDIDVEHNTILMKARDNIVSSIEDVQVGSKYPARVLKVLDSYVLVELGEKVFASSYITDALNNYSDKLENIFHNNDFATATILAIDSEQKKIAVSLRTDDAVDKVINSVEDLERGDVVKGFVKNVANNGVYVALGRSVHALVRVSDLSDSYLKDWKNYFKPQQQVVGKISACKEEGRILMTLKESEVNGELNHLKKFDELEVGEIYEGSVRRTTDFGVFIKLDGTLNISGLCHHSEIADNKVENVSALFNEGDRVKVKILAINNDKKQLSLGMKASYFNSNEDAGTQDEDVDMEDANSDESDSESDEEEDDDDDDNSNKDEENEANDEDEDEVMVDAFERQSDDESESDDDDEENTNTKGASTGLSTNGFDWTASILDQVEDESSSDEDEDFTQVKKKKKVQRIEDKTGDINTRAPQSVNDFERLLIGNPNSSILWMNYMSFQLQLSDIEKAREIGKRALKTINYREEQEKMNIWIALLNLETSFGTDESLEETFKEACQFMDSLIMHQKLVSIFTMSEKYDQADKLYRDMIKKFGQNVSVYVQYGSYLLDRGLNDSCHAILSKGLNNLPKRDHIELVKKFAQLEFNKGDSEQGRSLFEGLIADAPKRIDLWNIYIDQEIKQQEKKKVEELFERVLTKKISKKQAKFFFTKWLNFEEENNDETMATRVKAKAAEYVKNDNN